MVNQTMFCNLYKGLDTLNLCTYMQLTLSLEWNIVSDNEFKWNTTLC